jgi:DNA-directed RNA polymerase subunit M/transcription elongation factor TFIIS
MGKLKTGGRCPKCGGYLYLDRDYNGWYEQCLQCAYMEDLAVVYQDKDKKIAELVPVKKVQDLDKKEARHNK